VDSGHIVDMGTHEELLARKGLYNRLHTLQVSGGEPAGSVFNAREAGDGGLGGRIDP
jgi:hypothetical protein